MDNKKREFALSYIAIELKGWLDHHEEDMKKDGRLVQDDDHVMNPPAWPSRGTLKNWIKVLKNDGEYPTMDNKDESNDKTS